jgi:hypothetical protein
MLSEPVFITTNDFGPSGRGKNFDSGGQYITFCYVGQIPAGAVRPSPHFHPIPSQYLFLNYFRSMQTSKHSRFLSRLIRSAKNRRACLTRNITSVRCSSSRTHCRDFRGLRRTSRRSPIYIGGTPSKSSSVVKPTIVTARGIIRVVVLRL